MTIRSMRKLIVLIALACCSFSATAERKYAVLSIVGDRITIVTRAMSTGSNIDANKRDVMEIAGPGLDNAVLIAAEDGLKAADKGSEVLLLSPRGGLAEKAAGALREGSLQQWVSTQARAQLAALGATDVILISKHRADARLDVNGTTTGSGKLEGLGFYIDSSFSPQDDNSSAAAKGFLASYAYIILRQLDLQSGRTLAEQVVMASNSAIPGVDSVRAWDALGPAEKIGALRSLVTKEVEAAMPAVVSAASRSAPR